MNGDSCIQQLRAWTTLETSVLKSLVQCTTVVTLTNGSMWLTPLSHGVGRHGGPHSTYCQSFPLHPLHSLLWMNGLDVVGSSNVPVNDTFSFIPRVRLACIGLKLPLHAGKRVVRGVPCTHSTARSWCASYCPSCVCRSQWSASALQHSAGLSTFAAGVRRPLFSFFREGHSKVSDRNQKGVDPPWLGLEAISIALECSWRRD